MKTFWPRFNSPLSTSACHAVKPTKGMEAASSIVRFFGFNAASGGGDYSWIANASTKSAEFVAHAAVQAMLAGKRTVVPGLFNKLTCFGVRFLTRRSASRVATQVLGKPRLALPARRVT